MFESAVFESSGAMAGKRGWITLCSFLSQTAALGLLVLAPLLYSDALPRVQQFLGVVGPPPAPRAAREAPFHQPRRGSSEILAARLLLLLRVPRRVAMITDTEAPSPVASPGGPGVVGSTASSNASSPLNDILRPAGEVPIASLPPRPLAVSSGVLQGYLLHRVRPEYPPLARSARVQGTVVLHALISRDGTIEQLQVVSGPPLLIGAAVDAVRQWRYRPYYLNHQPIEVETQITVVFSLGG